MTLYIGVDIHARQQTVSYLNTEDGSLGQQELHHERDDIRGFYIQFSVEVKAIVGMGELAESQALDTIVNGSGQGMRECWRQRLKLCAQTWVTQNHLHLSDC